jgi:tetratricopeptide (TPR) repeat protein
MTKQQTWVALAFVVVAGAVAFYLGTRSGSRATAAQEEAARLVREKRHAEAAAKYEAIVEADPKNDFAWYQLASASRNAGNCARALVAYRHYVEMAPTRNEPYYGMGICQEKLGDRAGALASLRHFVANAKPSTAVGYVEHARTLIAALEVGHADAGSP